MELEVRAEVLKVVVVGELWRPEEGGAEQALAENQPADEVFLQMSADSYDAELSPLTYHHFLR